MLKNKPRKRIAWRNKFYSNKMLLRDLLKFDMSKIACTEDVIEIS